MSTTNFACLEKMKPNGHMSRSDNIYILWNTRLYVSTCYEFNLTCNYNFLQQNISISANCSHLIQINWPHQTWKVTGQSTAGFQHEKRKMFNKLSLTKKFSFMVGFQFRLSIWPFVPIHAGLCKKHGSFWGSPIREIRITHLNLAKKCMNWRELVKLFMLNICQRQQFDHFLSQ